MQKLGLWHSIEKAQLMLKTHPSSLLSLRSLALKGPILVNSYCGELGPSPAKLPSRPFADALIFLWTYHDKNISPQWHLAGHCTYSDPKTGPRYCNLVYLRHRCRSTTMICEAAFELTSPSYGLPQNL